MATLINSTRKRNMGDVEAVVFDAQLITGGTTITLNLPAGQRIQGWMFFNRTTDVMTVTAGTYDEATGVFTSPAMTVNDLAIATFFLWN